MKIQQIFANKYAFESSRRHLHTHALLCTAFGPLWNSTFSLKNAENFADFLNFFAMLQNPAKFQKIQLDNLVDFEKC